MLGNLFTTKTVSTTAPVAVPPSVAPPLPPVAPSPIASQVPVAPVVNAPFGSAPSPFPAPATQQVVGSSMQPSLRHDLSVLTHLDTRTTSVLQQAEKEAQRLQLQLMGGEQLLYGLLCDAQIFELMQKISTDASTIAQKLQQNEKPGTTPVSQPTLSEEALGIIEKSYTTAQKRDVEFITPEDVLMTMFSDAPSLAAFLQNNGITKEKIDEKLQKSTEYVTGKKSTLDKFGLDLTQEAREGRLDPVTGRDREIERLIHIMLRRSKNNPIIIGEAGVGKTAIVEGLAQRIISGAVPAELLNKTIFMLDLASMVAGASHRGEFEERLRGVIKETQLAGGKIVLFIDEIHTLIGAGDSGGAMDASNIIKPFLARGQLQIIGTTTTAEFRRYFEKDKAFERRFQSVLADEPTEEVAIEMLKVLRAKYEKFHHVTITDEAIEAAVHLSKKYIGERYLPDKAIDLLDEAAAEVKLQVAGLSHEDPTEKKATDMGDDETEHDQALQEAVASAKTPDDTKTDPAAGLIPPDVSAQTPIASPATPIMGNNGIAIEPANTATTGVTSGPVMQAGA